MIDLQARCWQGMIDLQGNIWYVGQLSSVAESLVMKWTSGIHQSLI
jgi:hypothetical protein